MRGSWVFVISFLAATRLLGAHFDWLTITNPTPARDDHFGYAVAAVGSETILIGARLDDTGAFGAGSAYLYNLSGSLLTTITNPTPQEQDVFGVSLARVGQNRLIVGAYNDRTGVTYAGAAYLFDLQGNLITTFTNPAPMHQDWFGLSVAGVGEDKVVIGSPLKEDPALVGAAYLFNVSGTLLTTFTNPNPASTEQFGDEFGIAVAGIGTDKVIIGAYKESRGARESGAAYIFSADGMLLTTITNPGPIFQDFERFGISVAAVGSDRVLIGAYNGTIGTNYGGAAYLFDLKGQLLTAFSNPTPDHTDDFAYSIAVLGRDKILIGDPGDDTGAIDSGAVYLFSINGTLLMTITNPTPAASDFFGISVATLGSDKIVVGAHGDDTGARNSGVAYVFTVSMPPSLYIVPTNGNITVFWENSTVDYVLEHTENLNRPTPWPPILPPYNSNSTHTWYTVPTAPDRRFFRLQKPE